MSRSTSRSRGGRALLAGLPLIAALAAAGCGAGQITETTEQAPDIDGVNAAVGSIALRNVFLAYPSGGVYEKGSEARLEAVIVNNSATPDRLVSVRGASATGSFMKTVTTQQLNPVCKCSPAASRPTAKTPRVQPIDIAIPAQATVTAYDDSGPQLYLTGLIKPFSSSQQTTVVFKFANAGTVSVKVPVAANESENEPSDQVSDQVSAQPSDQAQG